MSREERNYLISLSNWLSRLAARFNRQPLEYYLPLRQTLPTELDSYTGKYSNQPDYLYFKSMMQVENYTQRR